MTKAARAFLPTASMPRCVSSSWHGARTLKRLGFAPEAVADLREIALYIAADDPECVGANYGDEP